MTTHAKLKWVKFESAAATNLQLMLRTLHAYVDMHGTISIGTVDHLVFVWDLRLAPRLAQIHQTVQIYCVYVRTTQ